MGVESVFEQFATFGNSAAQRDTSGGSHDMVSEGSQDLFDLLGCHCLMIPGIYVMHME